MAIWTSNKIVNPAFYLETDSESIETISDFFLTIKSPWFDDDDNH